MSKKNAAQLKEKKIMACFGAGKIFNWLGEESTVIKSDKPTTSSGECKTDIYIEVKNKKGEKNEIKISVKLDNADFLENKISYERARLLFGNDCNEIISRSTKTIDMKFHSDPLINFKKQTIILGWKFELLNKKSGHKSGELHLTPDQILDVYAGTNLPDEKKNAIVNGESINNSGVANYILTIGEQEDLTTQEYADRLIPINEYTNGKKIYFACKALNYRIKEDKWDGDRPLAVYINWTINTKNKLKAEFVFSNPLKTKGNEVGTNLKNKLKALGINSNNFMSLVNDWEKSSL